MKLVIIMGLSASGKTTLVQQKVKELKVGDAGGKSKLTDITLNHPPHRQSVKDWLGSYGGAVMDTACCNPVQWGSVDEFLEDIKDTFPDLEVELLCFENNPLQCIKNALADPSGGDKRALARVRQICTDYETYEIPKWATIIPVAKSGIVSRSGPLT
jgi:hypothetical protein